MRPRNKSYLRPRCEKCGTRIYRIYHPFKNYLWRDIPSHCPKCGEQISYYKKEHLIEREALGFLIGCIICIAFLIVVFIIFNYYQIHSNNN